MILRLWTKSIFNQVLLVREMLPLNTSLSYRIDGKAFKEPKKRARPTELNTSPKTLFKDGNSGVSEYPLLVVDWGHVIVAIAEFDKRSNMFALFAHAQIFSANQPFFGVYILDFPLPFHSFLFSSLCLLGKPPQHQLHRTLADPLLA